MSLSFEKSSIAKYFAELGGTFLLVLFGCGAAMLTGNAMAIGAAFGLTIIVVGLTFGKLSGTHLNPVVSLVMLLKKDLGVVDFIFYVLSQVVGAVLAALVLYGIYSGFTINVSGTTMHALDSSLGSNIAEMFPTLTVGDWHWAGALFGFGWEILITFVFLLAILFACTKKDVKNPCIMIGVALTLIIVIGCAGPTGASVNPARSFGPAMISMIAGDFRGIISLPVMLTAPFVGGILALVAFKGISKRLTKDEAPVEECCCKGDHDHKDSECCKDKK